MAESTPRPTASYDDLGFVPSHEDFGFVPDKPVISRSQALGAHAANEAALGYGPQLLGAGKTVYGILTGNGEVKDLAPNYTTKRDEIAAYLEQAKEQHPNYSMAGELVGSAIPVGGIAKILPILKEATFAKKVGRGAAQGLIYGEAKNPGETPGEISPYQGDLRAEDAVIGAGLGAVGGAVGAKAGEFLAKRAAGTQETSDWLATKASGAMKRDYKKILAKDNMDDLAGTLRNADALRFPNDLSNVAQRVAAEKEVTGAAIGKVFQEVEQNAKIGINTSEMAKAMILDPALQVLRTTPGREGDYKAAIQYLSTLYNNGEGLSLSQAQTLRQGIEKAINFNKPRAELTGSQEYLYKIRDSLSGTINDAVNAYEKMAPETFGPDGQKIGPVIDRLKMLNQEYNHLSTLEDMATDRLAQVDANRAFRPSEIYAAGTGLAAGMAHGGNPINALIGSAALGGAMHLTNKYGAATGSRIMNAVAAGTRKGAEMAVPLGAGISVYSPEIRRRLEGKPASEMPLLAPDRKPQSEVASYSSLDPEMMAGTTHGMSPDEIKQADEDLAKSKGLDQLDGYRAMQLENAAKAEESKTVLIPLFQLKAYQRMARELEKAKRP